ncbi:BnaC06g15630D [Brassica napus]|uniref:BnaC06g15630D protein n=1 Tax=Brassica napus TaxID=3708 RepID=A0A078F297_BRANA|nr:BnaC06g15630D [Brassica napus]
MSSRKKRVAKSGGKEIGHPEEVVGNQKLPSRLFVTDRYPSKRVNLNASLEYLLLVRDVLEGTDEMERLLGSCFGALFRLPVRRCAFSAKLVHGLLTRQLVTKKRLELWPVFGGDPMRFSLAEFGHVTGLPCGEFEEGYVVDDKARQPKGDYVFWDRLLGAGRRDITIAEVAAMIAGDKEMPPTQKLKLCLIIIVDGILLATNQEPKPYVKHVKRLEKLDRFLSFQWGRESFWWTISSMIPPAKVIGKCDDPNGVFCRKLRQETKVLAGFPWALQLWAFEVIPGLIARLGGKDEQTLLTYGGEKLPQHTGLGLVDVLHAEHDPKVTVQPMYEPGGDKEDGWGEFDCEILDRKVASDEDGDDQLVADPSGKKEQDVVPLEAVYNGGVDKEGTMIFFGSGSNTFYVTEDEDDDVGSLRGDDGDGGGIGTEEDFGELNKLVGVITRDALITSPVQKVCEDHTLGKEPESKEKSAAEEKGDVGETEVEKVTIHQEKDEAIEEEAVKEGRFKEKEDGGIEDVGGSEGLVNVADEEKGDVTGTTCEVGAPDGVEGGNEDESAEDKMLAREETMVELSDSSPCPRSEKHKPVEKEADLAALLLAKERFTMDKLVPEVEDTYYAFFESVLVANPKVLHLNAGGYNLENQFFLDLAALRKWVSTEHMEALIDYVGVRHDERLRQRRCIFLKPWFVAHLHGKAHSFNAAKFNKGRVVEDVDTLYTPMIWDGNHWVGLCISLTDWRVLVLDPNPKLKDMGAMRGLLDSVAQMLPYLVEKVCPPPAEGAYNYERFAVERMGGSYENRRSGDCGPVAIKFMELHALGNPHPRMDGLTDDLVDLIRKQFAMDLYKDWVVPLYIGDEMN